MSPNDTEVKDITLSTFWIILSISDDQILVTFSDKSSRNRGYQSHVSKCSTCGQETCKLGHMLKHSTRAFLAVAITLFACPLKRFSCRRAMLDAGPHHAVRPYSTPIGRPAPKTALPLVTEIPRDQHTTFYLPR